MILDNLPDILNMVIRRIENFLRAFEKKFGVKNRVGTFRIGLVKYRDMLQKGYFFK